MLKKERERNVDTESEGASKHRNIEEFKIKIEINADL